jgi:hypothetical protein
VFKDQDRRRPMSRSHPSRLLERSVWQKIFESEERPLWKKVELVEVELPKSGVSEFV